MPRELISAEKMDMTQRFMDMHGRIGEPPEPESQDTVPGQAPDEPAPPEPDTPAPDEAPAPLPDTEDEPQIEVQPDSDGSEEEPIQLGFSTLAELADAAEVPAELILESLRVPTKVNGQAADVSLAELRKGYQQAKANTLNFEDNARERKAIEAERQAIETARNETLARIEQRVTELDTLLESDAAELQAYLDAGDTDSYLRKQQQVLGKMAVRNQAVEAHKAEQDKAAAERNAQVQQRMAQTNEQIRSFWPELYDQAAGPALGGEMRKYLTASGFNDAELQRLPMMGAGAFKVIKDAMAYQKLQDKKPGTLKRVAKAAKMSRPGAPSKPTDEKQDLAQRLRTRSIKSGKLHDVQRAYAARSARQ